MAITTIKPLNIGCIIVTPFDNTVSTSAFFIELEAALLIFNGTFRVEFYRKIGNYQVVLGYHEIMNHPDGGDWNIVAFGKDSIIIEY